MKGTYEIEVRNRRIVFNLTIERNITVIRGDSATGKTTLVDMIQSFERYGEQSGITIQCKKPCRVLSDPDWQDRLEKIHDSIVFLDEGNRFITSAAFARAIMGTDNYYVLVTRENLYQLPYSVNSVLKLKTTASRFKTTYVRSYPHYEYIPEPMEQLQHLDRIITEDSNSGYEMFRHIAAQFSIECESAQGKSNILLKLAQHSNERILVVADGAAFGAEMDRIYTFYNLKPGKITLYLPESFEWLLLKSGVLGDRTPNEVLNDPSEHIESKDYFSWEQFFTALLTELTQDTYMQYSKHHLNEFYLQSANVERILEAMKA